MPVLKARSRPISLKYLQKELLEIATMKADSIVDSCTRGDAALPRGEHANDNCCNTGKRADETSQKPLYIINSRNRTPSAVAYEGKRYLTKLKLTRALKSVCQDIKKGGTRTTR